MIGHINYVGKGRDDLASLTVSMHIKLFGLDP